jgi:hypothetical protein
MERIYVSIDIETGGPVFQINPLYGIGYYINSSIYGCLYKATLCIKQLPFQIMNKNTYQGFWLKNMHILERIKQNAKDIAVQVKTFIDIIDSLEDRIVNGLRPTIIFICDNPSFDISFIDYWAYALFKRNPIRYSKIGEYRSIIDPTERIVALGIYKEAKKLASIICKHSHWPEDDAEHNYHLYQISLSFQELIRKDNRPYQTIKQWCIDAARVNLDYCKVASNGNSNFIHVKKEKYVIKGINNKDPSK